MPGCSRISDDFIKTRQLTGEPLIPILENEIAARPDENCIVPFISVCTRFRDFGRSFRLHTVLALYDRGKLSLHSRRAESGTTSRLIVVQIRFNTDLIVDCIPQSLLATEISLGGLYANVAEQKLNLL